MVALFWAFVWEGSLHEHGVMSYENLWSQSTRPLGRKEATYLVVRSGFSTMMPLRAMYRMTICSQFTHGSFHSLYRANRSKHYIFLAADIHRLKHLTITTWSAAVNSVCVLYSDDRGDDLLNTVKCQVCITCSYRQ
jgi:hypothetical protein